MNDADRMTLSSVLEIEELFTKRKEIRNSNRYHLSSGVY